MFVILILSCLTAFVSATWLPTGSLETRDTSRTSTFDKVFWANEGYYRCTSEQKDAIIAAIDEAHVLVNQVIQALSVEKAEKSKAFLTWFGEALRKNIFTTSRPPSPATTKSLIYACEPEALSSGGRIAHAETITPNPTESIYRGPTYILFYPSFFADQKAGQTMENVAREWRRYPNLEDLVAGSLTFIHEFQHIYLATGPDRVCYDMPDPKSPSGEVGCYYPSCSCRSLPDEQKTKNAENFSDFAAYVYTWPNMAEVPLNNRPQSS
ncbi:hypothetical protein LZ31DRAFT_536726 [Colletotrichum somersetense]|nr:hypothetical protein LZ31DRAFT_536726 [Colletotrichum somersetense]